MQLSCWQKWLFYSWGHYANHNSEKNIDIRTVFLLYMPTCSIWMFLYPSSQVKSSSLVVKHWAHDPEAMGSNLGVFCCLFAYKYSVEKNREHLVEMPSIICTFLSDLYDFIDKRRENKKLSCMHCITTSIPRTVISTVWARSFSLIVKYRSFHVPWKSRFQRC